MDAEMLKEIKAHSEAEGRMDEDDVSTICNM